MDNYNLQQTDAKIQAILNKVQPVVDNNTVAGFGNGYAISTTAGATAAKEVTINGFTPTIGGIFSVLFQNGFTASDPTLNVSNTGAKDLKLFGSALPASFVPDGTILTLTYDGTNYNVVGRLNDITVKSTLESTDTPLLQDANGNFIKSTPAALASLLGVIGSRKGNSPTNTSAISGTGAATSITENQDILALPSGMYVQNTTSTISTLKNTPISALSIKEIEVLRINSSGYGVTLCFFLDGQNDGYGYYTFSRGTTHQQWKRMF